MYKKELAEARKLDAEAKRARARGTHKRAPKKKPPVKKKATKRKKVHSRIHRAPYTHIGVVPGVELIVDRQHYKITAMHPHKSHKPAEGKSAKAVHKPKTRKRRKKATS